MSDHVIFSRIIEDMTPVFAFVFLDQRSEVDHSKLGVNLEPVLKLVVSRTEYWCFISILSHNHHLTTSVMPLTTIRSWYLLYWRSARNGHKNMWLIQYTLTVTYVSCTNRAYIAFSTQITNVLIYEHVLADAMLLNAITCMTPWKHMMMMMMICNDVMCT